MMFVNVDDAIFVCVYCVFVCVFFLSLWNVAN